MGIAAWVGGLLLQREPSGHVTHYWMCAVIAAAASLLAFHLAKKIDMHQ
jgi:predicted MFS family arabinose efflux permease